MYIQAQQSETMQIQQHTIQCAFDVDERELDDVLDEMQQQNIDEIDETHRTVAMTQTTHQLATIE